MIHTIIDFCLTHLDVFDGLVIGILFTLICKWLQRKLTPPVVNVTSIGAPIEFKSGGTEALKRALDRNRDSVARSMAQPHHTADDIEL
jgi:hypothetical protein